MSSSATLLDVAIGAALTGGEIDRAAFRSGGPQAVEEKYQREGFNPVTEVDKKSEAAIVAYLKRYFPDHAILGEEGSGDTSIDRAHLAEQLWIVDPIDGTSNFIHGVPQYGVSVGYAEAGTMLVAACYDPERDEMFTAERGGGAYLNGSRIYSSRAASLAEAMVCTGFYYERGAVMERTLATIRRLFGAGIHGIRRLGSAVLDISWVAAGRFDAFFEYTLSPWDYAAPSLILEEAGGRAAAADGSALSFHSGSVAVASPRLFDEFIQIVAAPTEQA